MDFMAVWTWEIMLTSWMMFRTPSTAASNESWIVQIKFMVLSYHTDTSIVKGWMTGFWAVLHTPNRKSTSALWRDRRGLPWYGLQRHFVSPEESCHPATMHVVSPVRCSHAEWSKWHDTCHFASVKIERMKARSYLVYFTDTIGCALPLRMTVQLPLSLHILICMSWMYWLAFRPIVSW